jgi:hypothetical protein
LVLLRLRAALPWAYCFGLLWLNAYLVRHVFFLTFTGATNAMHGYWIALGRLMGDRWLIPQWVPYWAGGMPAELTYAPLVPWLGWHLGIYAVMAAIFAIGPAALFAMAWQLSGKPGWAFVAGVVYSLYSPTELLVPDGEFNWIHVVDSRRLYLNFVWDEAPHQLALAMVCLAVAAWARGWQTAAAVAIAVGALANPFGITGAALFGLCWVLVSGNWRIAAISGAVAYLIVCPFYPPSLLGVLRSNSLLVHESAWTPGSWLGLLVVSAGVALLWLLTRQWAPVRRFAMLLAWVTTAIPVLYVRWDIVLLQQPGRYKCEMALALALFFVFGLERVLAGRARWLTAALAVLGIALAARQIVELRRYSRNEIRQAAAENTIEYSAAREVKGTVFTVGSLAHWINVYRDARQYSGGSFPTTPNPVQQRLVQELTVEKSWEKFVLWMQATGVDSVLSPGRRSPEFWKPFANDVLAGHLPVLWEERDTRLYQIPRTRRTMVHSIPGLIPLEPYVKAIEDPAAPPLSMEWLSNSRGFVRGSWRPGDMVLVHMNWHKGWKAYLNGREAPTGADGLGQMVIVPGGAGELELVFGRGWEPWAMRAISALTLLTLLFRSARTLFRRSN